MSFKTFLEPAGLTYGSWNCMHKLIHLCIKNTYDNSTHLFLHIQSTHTQYVNIAIAIEAFLTLSGSMTFSFLLTPFELVMFNEMFSNRCFFFFWSFLSHQEIFPILTPEMSDLGLNPQHNRNRLVFYCENMSWDSVRLQYYSKKTEGMLRGNKNVVLHPQISMFPCLDTVGRSDELFIWAQKAET